MPPGAQFTEPLNATNSKTSFQQSIDEHMTSISIHAQDLKCEVEPEISGVHYRNFY